MVEGVPEAHEVIAFSALVQHFTDSEICTLRDEGARRSCLCNPIPILHHFGVSGGVYENLCYVR